jgi:hypothetical protein
MAGRYCLDDLGIDGRIILKWILVRMWVDLYGSEYGPGIVKTVMDLRVI